MPTGAGLGVALDEDKMRHYGALLDGLASIGTATASSELYKMGIRNPLIAGAASHSRGKVIAGPAVTLQFMPKRDSGESNPHVLRSIGVLAESGFDLPLGPRIASRSLLT